MHKKKRAQKKVAIDTKNNKKHEVCTMGGVGGHTNTGIPLALINSELQGPMQRDPYFILTYHTSYYPHVNFIKKRYTNGTQQSSALSITYKTGRITLPVLLVLTKIPFMNPFCLRNFCIVSNSFSLKNLYRPRPFLVL